MPENFVIGIDYGTDTVRAIIANASNGAVASSAVYEYPRWRDKLFCDPASNRFRQHPRDYIDGLEFTVRECLRQAGALVTKNVVAISIDTTGSTPVAVNREGVPLALTPEFEYDPDAMFILWKDHSATREAAEINAHAAKFDTNYLQLVGGIYSSEWFWAKLLFILRKNPAVRTGYYTWVEHCDWIPFLLTGGRDVHMMKRSVCAAGHKALWSAEFDGLPPNDFFASLDPLLEGLTRRLYNDTYTADRSAGTLSSEWAARFGLNQEVVVGVGAFDAHMGAVGAQIEPYHLSKVMGTSTCDMLVAPAHEMENKLVRGICGQVDGSVIPGMIGLEAGQSAFGDTYAWYRDLLGWPLDSLLMRTSLVDCKTARALSDEVHAGILSELSRQAAALEVKETTGVALDWFNGRRTPNANQELKAAITGLSLASSAPEVFYMLAEATCFGAKKIVDCFTDQGIPVKGLIGLGGVAKKSPFIMQLMADVMDMPIRIHSSEQSCATGATMFAATAAGLYNNVQEAMCAMGSGFEQEYKPEVSRTGLLQKRFQQFSRLSEEVENSL